MSSSNIEEVIAHILASSQADVLSHYAIVDQKCWHLEIILDSLI